MSFKTPIRRAILVMSMLAIGSFFRWHGLSPSQVQGQEVFDSPLPTPTATPLPAPTPIASEYGKQALAYLSEKYGIPVEHLLIEYELETSYPLSGRTFRHFVISDTHDPQWPTYTVLVEITTGVIEEDVRAIERAEEAAYLAKYGKLQPALYERLQEVADDAVLPVAIWVGGRPVRTGDEILAILASEFPEAAKAIAEGTKPIDVGDEEIATRIQARYEELLNENVEARLQPVQTWLQQKDYSFERIEGMPSLAAILPKTAILELAQMQEVGLVYLVEEKGEPGMDIAAASDRVPRVWSLGMSGNGVNVAVLDIDRIDPACLNIVATKNPGLGIAAHATKVANIVSCNTDPYRGIAYGASIVDGGFADNLFSQTSVIDSLKWATESPQSAKAVNVSVGWELDGNMNWLDRAFDYWTRARFVTVAVLSHNQNSYVRTPGKAWNVITVGGSDDKNTITWTDDSTTA